MSNSGGFVSAQRAYDNAEPPDDLDDEPDICWLHGIANHMPCLRYEGEE